MIGPCCASHPWRTRISTQRYAIRRLRRRITCSTLQLGSFSPTQRNNIHGGGVTFLADSPDAVFEAARAGGGVILLRPGSDSGLEDFPGVIWAGVELEEACWQAAAGAYVWVAQEDVGWTFAVPLIFRTEADPEVWLRTFRAGLRTGSSGADDLVDANEGWLICLERPDWTALLAHPAPELRGWAMRNLWRMVQPPKG